MKKAKKSFGQFFVRPVLSGAIFALSALMVFGVVAYAQGAPALIESLIGKINNTTVGTGPLSVNGDNLLWSEVGGQLSKDQNGSIELGGFHGQAGNGSPYIDFHSSDNQANGNDYNVRIINDPADTLQLEGKVNITGSLCAGGNCVSKVPALLSATINEVNNGGGAACKNGKDDNVGIRLDWTTVCASRYCQARGYVAGMVASHNLGVGLDEPNAVAVACW